MLRDYSSHVLYFASIKIAKFSANKVFNPSNLLFLGEKSKYNALIMKTDEH